jgi:tellurite methyltransferase
MAEVSLRRLTPAAAGVILGTIGGDLENKYEERYRQPGYYWGRTPSSSCYRVLQLLPPDRPLRLLDIGCGEGRNAVFFARNGYQVTAFDASATGIEKTRKMAAEAGVPIEAFVADINEYRLEAEFDILFSTGVLQYVPPEARPGLFADYRDHKSPNGLNVFSVFVKKPFIPRAPDSETAAHKWISGELFSHYQDWKIEYCTEEIFDCMSSGIPHKHAIDRIVARNPAQAPGRAGATQPSPDQ